MNAVAATLTRLKITFWSSFSQSGESLISGVQAVGSRPRYEFRKSVPMRAGYHVLVEFLEISRNADFLVPRPWGVNLIGA